MIWFISVIFVGWFFCPVSAGRLPIFSDNWLANVKMEFRTCATRWLEPASNQRMISVSVFTRLSILISLYSVGNVEMHWPHSNRDLMRNLQTVMASLYFLAVRVKIYHPVPRRRRIFLLSLLFPYCLFSTRWEFHLLIVLIIFIFRVISVSNLFSKRQTF